LIETIARRMVIRGLKGVRFFPIKPDFHSNLDGIGWYVHLPFCRRLCPYCGFRSFRYSEQKVNPYIEGVKKEVSIYKSMLGDVKIGDIYFGGGTPSLTWEGVIEVIDHIRSEFKVEGEIGMEANPEDIHPAMCKALRKSGVEKISLGVQSFDDGILRSMGRGYNGDAALETIQTLLDEGFYLSIDLMHSLPGQEIPSLVSDLEKVAKIGVHQISYYPLNLFPYTRWYTKARKGEIEIPGKGMQKDMYYAVSDFLSSNGYRQDTCWDFKHQTLGVKEYVTCGREENIGLGVNAYSRIGNLFYTNTYSLNEYIKAVEGGLPIATGTILPSTQKDLMRQYFMMGLYSLRVDKGEFERRFGVRMEKALRSFLFLFKLLSLIQENSEEVKLTRKGMYYSSLMTKIFMVTLPGKVAEECLRRPWPEEFKV
jgi:oxygen-independent coproporphyrinogen-3 oxidase